jgi:hypothetical protein
VVIAFVWDEHFVSVGSKQIRKPKAAAGCMVG